MARTTERRRGSTIVEFTLVGIPLIFVLISVFEMARGMWIYHTVAHAVKEGTRFAIVHGYNCSISPNSCQRTVGDVVRVVRDAGVGLDPGQLNLTLTAESSTPITCNPASTCLGRTDIWPPYPANQPGISTVEITATYPFESAIAMFWPGAAGPGGKGMNFPRFNLPASSRETIQF